MKLFKTPVFAKKVFPKRNWSFSVSKPSVFLTFDDGPEPDVTPKVLDLLLKYNAKATFFCVGENVKEHPEIFRRILNEGHAVGNHTMHHLNALNFTKKNYLNDVAEANSWIKSKLFRPPYGRLDTVKGRAIGKDYKIVMWSFLTYDYDKNVALDLIKEKLQDLRSGDVIVLHDNKKSKERSLDVLQYILIMCAERQWECLPISLELCK